MQASNLQDSVTDSNVSQGARLRSRSPSSSRSRDHSKHSRSRSRSRSTSYRGGSRGRSRSRRRSRTYRRHRSYHSRSRSRRHRGHKRRRDSSSSSSSSAGSRVRSGHSKRARDNQDLEKRMLDILKGQLASFKADMLKDKASQDKADRPVSDSAERPPVSPDGACGFGPPRSPFRFNESFRDDRSTSQATIADSSFMSEQKEEGLKEEDKIRLQQRRSWFSTLHRLTPDLHREEEEVPLDKGAAFFPGQPKTTKKVRCSLAIAEGLEVQLQNKADLHFERIRKGKGPWPAAKTIAGYYPVPKDQDKMWSKPHAVPRILIDEVEDSKMTQKNVAEEVRLVATSDQGKVEQSALHRAEVGTTAIRICNNLNLDVNALVKVNTELKKKTADFRARPGPSVDRDSTREELMAALIQRESEVSDFMAELSGQLTLAAEGLQDASTCSSDLFNLHASLYTSAITDRRAAWLKASKLPADVQKQVTVMPVVLPAATKKAPLDLVGPEGVARLEEYQVTKERRDKAAYASLANFGAQTKIQQQAQKKKNNPQQKNQNNVKKQNQAQKPFPYKSPLPEPKPMSTEFGRGGGFRGGRGRGDRGGRGGRGAQGKPTGRGQQASNQF